MLPRNVTPVNLEVLRRLKLALVELESKAASLRCSPLRLHLCRCTLACVALCSVLLATAAWLLLTGLGGHTNDIAAMLCGKGNLEHASSFQLAG